MEFKVGIELISRVNPSEYLQILEITDENVVYFTNICEAKTASIHVDLFRSWWEKYMDENWVINHKTLVFELLNEYYGN